MFSVAVTLLLAAGSCVNSLDLIQPDSVVVQPGQSVTVTCQVSGYSLTDGTYATGWIRHCEGKPMDWISHQWGGGSGSFYQNDALKNKFSYSRDTSAGTVTLKGQNLQPEDTAVYHCVREIRGLYYGFDYWGKGTMVTVTSATQTKPTVFPLMECGSGVRNTVTLGCLATGFTPSSLTFAWNKVNGDALTDFIQYPPVQKGDVYSRISQIEVSRQDWDAKNAFRCAVSHGAGNGEVSFEKPIVLYQQPTFKVGAFAGKENEVSFSCVANDFSPKDFEISWLKNGKEITDKIYEFKTLTPEERKDGNGITLYSVASFITLPFIDETAIKMICKFTGKSEMGPKVSYANVNYTKIVELHEGCQKADVDVKIEGPTAKEILLSKKAVLKCNVKVNTLSTYNVSWENQRAEIIAGTSKSIQAKTEGETISVPVEIAYDEWIQGTKFYCIVEHPNWFEQLKTTYERINGGETQRPSVFMLPPVEHTRKETVTLTCYVKDFFPREVFVSWLVDDENAESRYEFHTTDPVKNKGTYSAYGQLTLSLDDWQNSGKLFSCLVYHESLANTTKAIVRSIGQKTFENTNLVNFNMNIPEMCKPQ